MTGRTQHALLERDAELDELGSVIDAAAAGSGCVVVLEGAAGTGKSALLAAACKRGARAGLRVLRAGGSEFEGEFAFGVVRRLFAPALLGYGSAQRERLLAGAAAPAAWVVLPERNEQGRAGAEFAVLNGIYWLAANLSAEAPLLLAVDDLHWADGPSVRSLAHLGRRLADLPVALVVALRPEEPGAPAELLDELRSTPGTAHADPRPLSAAAVASVVRAEHAGASDELCAACHTATGGNPLYLRELLRTLHADGTLADGDGLAAIGDAAVPTLAAGVARRVERVHHGAPALARAMAVLGDGDELALATALAGLDAGDAAAIAHDLVRIEVLATDEPFAFVHPLVRRSVYDAIPDAEREAAHAAAARLLAGAGASPESVGAHLARLTPSGSAAVAATLRDAAREALSRAAPETAIRHLRRALAEQAPDPPRASLLFELGQAELAIRDAGAVASLQGALALADERELRARISVLLTELVFNSGQWDRGTELLESAQREFGDDSRFVVGLEAIRALTSVYDPRVVDEFDRLRPRFEVLARREGWDAGALSVLLETVAVLRCEDVSSVEEVVRRAIDERGLLTGRPAGEWAASQALTALTCADRNDAALAVCEQIAAEGRRTGSLLALVMAAGYRGHVANRRGDLADAEAQLRSVLHTTVESGMALWVATAVNLFKDTIVERSGLDDVAAMVHTAELPPALLATAGGAMTLETRARLRQARGDDDGALADLRAAASVLARVGFGPTVSRWRSGLALALPEASRDEAQSLVAEELALARRTGLPRPEGIALRASGLLGGAAGVELLAASVEVLEASDSRYEHARSLVELGAALRWTGRAADARETLAAGLDLAQRCGAVRLAGRAEEELRAAGARPRRRELSGAGSLTASELRVAQLASTGHTNREIAQELFVSPKTVETHLSSAYGKLGLSGRGARGSLATALRA